MHPYKSSYALLLVLSCINTCPPCITAYPLMHHCLFSHASQPVLAFIPACFHTSPPVNYVSPLMHQHHCLFPLHRWCPFMHSFPSSHASLPVSHVSLPVIHASLSIFSCITACFLCITAGHSCIPFYPLMHHCLYPMHQVLLFSDLFYLDKKTS